MNSGLRIEEYTAAILREPHVASHRVARGIEYDEIGETQKALADFEEAIRLDPLSDRAYRNRAIVLDKLERHDEALEDFNRAVHLGPGDFRNYFQRGLSSGGIRRVYRDAISDFDEAIRLEPGDPYLYHHRGFAFACLGEYRRAIEDYDRTLALSPNLDDVLHNRGIAFLYAGEFERAVSDLSEVIDSGKSYPETFFYRSLALVRLRRLDEALAIVDRAIAMDGNEPRFFDLRSSIRNSQGDFADGLQDADRALHLNPDVVGALFEHALSLRSLGRSAKALGDFERIITFDSRNPEAYYGKGLAQAEVGDFGAAVTSYSYAIECRPDDAAFFLARGIAWWRLEHWERAVEDFDRTLHLNPRLSFPTVMLRIISAAQMQKPEPETEG